MNLSPTLSRFVLHWGEMGTRWGVNRTVAQIHALLYITGRPMHAEEIVDTLGVARSNVSTSIRELQGWKLVTLVHLNGYAHAVLPWRAPSRASRPTPSGACARRWTCWKRSPPGATKCSSSIPPR